MNTSFTIVTAIYDLKAREGNIGIERAKDMSFYLNKGKDLFGLHCNLIVFCDESLYTDVKLIPRPEGTSTCITQLNLEDLEFYKDLEVIKKLRDNGSFYTGNPNKDTSLFMILQWSKFEFLPRAVQIIKSLKWPGTHVLWSDFGLSYVAKDIHRISEFKPTSKFKLLCLRPTYNSETQDLNFFRAIQGRSGGGIFLIPISKLDIYVELFKDAKNMFLRHGITPLEDEILTYVRVKNPELFDLYFGDYEDIVRNFNDECWSAFGIIHLGCISATYSNDTNTLKAIISRVYSNREYYLNSKAISISELQWLMNIYLNIINDKDEEKLREEVTTFLLSLV